MMLLLLLLLMMMMMMMMSCIKRPPSRVAALVLSLCLCRHNQLHKHRCKQRNSAKLYAHATMRVEARLLCSFYKCDSKQKLKQQTKEQIKQLLHSSKTFAAWRQFECLAADAPPPNLQITAPSTPHTSAASHKRLPLASGVTLLVERWLTGRAREGGTHDCIARCNLMNS